MKKIYYQKFSKNYKFGIIIERFNPCCKNLKLRGNPYKTGIRYWKDSINTVIAFVYKNKRIVICLPLMNNIGESCNG